MSTHWLDPMWRETALAWARDQLAELGIAITGEVTQPRVRAWSTILRLPVDGDDVVWFKANGGNTTYEPALLAALGRWVPDAVVAPIAVEVSLGWSLLPDGGETLRETHERDGLDLGDWEKIAVRCAEVQRRVVPHAEELVAMGVPNLPPAAMPGHLAMLIEEYQLDRIRVIEPQYARWCAELAVSDVPISIQHNDLHSGNVLTQGFRIFDWGDAYVGHPFGVLLVMLRRIVKQFGVSTYDPDLARVRDAYLEPWGGVADRKDLLETARIAVRVDPVARVLSWRRALAGASQEDYRRWSPSIFEWIEELLVAPVWPATGYG